MSYASITFGDRNPLKRWLQGRRLVSALDLARRAGCAAPSVVCDFGAGNGELCKGIRLRYPGARIVCHEPTPVLLEEARENLRHLDGVRFTGDAGGIGRGSVDLLFALEVFEHLPERTTEETLRRIGELLRPGGWLVVGVPVEIGPPALYKGVFRMMRRRGAFDARLANILRAAAGRPPEPRPVGEIAPGLPYHFEHLGFDHRRLRRRLEAAFEIRAVACSPFARPGSWLMPEITLAAVRR